jgi:hypothetical protein
MLQLAELAGLQPAVEAFVAEVFTRLVQAGCLGEAGPLSQGVQAGRKSHRIRHINGVEVRKKMPGGFK